jgi:orotidine-5'-phosphate decarboxylase
MGFFSLNHGIIPACDVNSLDELGGLIRDVDGVKGIVGYKAGKRLQSRYSLPVLVRTVGQYTEKPMIFDAQKEGNDVEFTEKDFISDYAVDGVKSLIIFPFAGPRVQATCVKTCYEKNILPIGGFRLTQEGFDETESVEMGDIDSVFGNTKFRGYISKDAEERALQVYTLMGVAHFIGPANKVDKLKDMKAQIKGQGIDPSFLMPGIGRQKGEVSSAFEAVDDCAGAYGIVGSGIYKAKDRTEAAEMFCEEALKFE